MSSNKFKKTCICLSQTCILTSRRALDKYFSDLKIERLLAANDCDDVGCSDCGSHMLDTVKSTYNKQFEFMNKSQCAIIKRCTYIEGVLDTALDTNKRFYKTHVQRKDILDKQKDNILKIRELNGCLISSLRDLRGIEINNNEMIKNLRKINKMTTRENKRLRDVMSKMTFPVTNVDKKTPNDVSDETPYSNESDESEESEGSEGSEDIEGSEDVNIDYIGMYQQLKDFMVLENKSLSALMSTHGIIGSFKRKATNKFYDLQIKRNIIAHPKMSAIKSIEEFFVKLLNL